MFGIVKIAGLSAMLSAGLVTAFDQGRAPQTAPVVAKRQDRISQDDSKIAAYQMTVETTGSTAAPRRASQAQAGVGKGDFVRPASADCAGQTWPNIPHECLTAADGRPGRQTVRIITLEERRADEGTSVLVRWPAVEVARR